MLLSSGLFQLYENKSAQVVKKAIQRHKTAGFQTNGFGIFCKNVFYVEIIPSKELIEIRNEIVNNLSNFCHLAEHDYKQDWKAHITIVKEKSSHNQNIKAFLDSQEIENIKQIVKTMSIVKNNNLFYELDFDMK